MAKIQDVQRYDRRLREDMQELSSNLSFGQPLNGQKAGNMRMVFLAFTLPGVANTTFAVDHELDDVPQGYQIIGTPTGHIVPLSPGTDAGGALRAWTSKRIYLKSSETSKIVYLMLWGPESSGG